MANCVLCNAEIRWAEIDGTMVALDAHEVGPGQERVTRVDEEWRPVRRDANVQAFVKHRETCPYGLGRG